jgi:hypothetical protein
MIWIPNIFRTVTALLFILCSLPSAAAEKKAKPGYDVWVEDCLEKVWQDKAMPENAVREIKVHAARGEYEAAQIAVRPKDDSTDQLRAVCSELKHKSSGKILPPAQVRYVDYVPVTRNSWQTPPEQLIITAPAWVPDVLCRTDGVPVWQNHTRPIWLTFHVPPGAQAGIYSGQVTIFANDQQWAVPVTLRIHNTTVPAEKTLKVTNWVDLDAMARWNGCRFFDDRFWEFARLYAENMAAHRQNMILIPLYDFYKSASLVEIAADGENLKFDFSNFDRWAQIFLDAGFTYLEGSHLGWIDQTISIRQVRDGKLVHEKVLADNPQAQRYLSQFLPALQSHLEKKGWIDIYYQHIWDEPEDAHKKLYNKTMTLLHQVAPKIKTIEATHSADIEPPTIMVPLLSQLADKHDFYKKLQDKGQEVWFYTACVPNGSYANRFLDLHLLKVRYLHWLNFKYNAPGFLEWGYNWWGPLSPYSDIYTTGSLGPLPPGDSYVVYPTPAGLWDSIRWETERDGIEDYELLKLLQAKDPKKAKTICSSMIRGFDKYDVDIGRFREARLKLLKSLEP